MGPVAGNGRRNEIYRQPRSISIGGAGGGLVPVRWVIWHAISSDLHSNYLELGYPTEVTCSASTIFSGIFKESDYPESIPVASELRYKFKLKDGRDLKLYWMDGGIIPDRPDELDPDLNMNLALGDIPEENDFEGGTLFVGTKGKVSCGWGGSHPRLLPFLLNKDVNVPKKYPRVEGGMDGHWWQWIDACIAGYGNAEVDSPFVGYAGPLNRNGIDGKSFASKF